VASDAVRKDSHSFEQSIFADIFDRSLLKLEAGAADSDIQGCL